MSSLSLMEWNTKPPIQWDWENLIMFNPATENPKKLRSSEWEIDGERGIDSGSGSDLGLASLSKSSKSVSNTSSSAKFSLETTEAIPEKDSGDKKAFSGKGTGSVGSGEPLLGLKLGKRTYFEELAGSSSKTSSFSLIPGSSVSVLVSPIKRSKSGSQATPPPRCQVEGCTLDLSLAKDYHRKHRVCESHSKCPKVIVAGLERRFCQQCSRFHGLSEFDEKKRSCRRRLSDHNARRRKPQPETIQLNTGRLYSSLYDERQHMSLVWNRTPLVHARPTTNLTWEGTMSSKFTITKGYSLKPGKGDIDGHLHLPGNELMTSIPMHHHDSKSSLPSKAKVNASEVLNQGLEESIILPRVDATRDLQRALSLLSTNSWGSSCEPKSISHEQPPSQTSHMGMPPQPVLPVIPQGIPVSSSDYWRTKHQHYSSTESRVHNLTSHTDTNNYFQEFQLLRAPYDGDSYSTQLN